VTLDRAPSSDLPHVFLLRLSGELGTKARVTRAQFVTRLVRNLRGALARAGIEASVVRRHERVRVEAADPAAEAVLARVFGLQSLSKVERRRGGSLDEVVAAGVELFRDAVRGRRFAVRARRVGEARPAFTARDVDVALGEALRPLAARVDLDDPEVTVHLELYEGQAWFFRERVPGPGGLPLGSSGRAVALVSGGFDSAVAAWQIERRGVALEHVFCNLGGAAHELGVLRVMKVVAERWSAGARSWLHAVDFAAVAAELRERTEPRYWQVLLKRQMLRAAERVARERHALAIVTGEAVGQVSSQTLGNLAVISQATTLPILRPLVGANKDEIIALAERIGTAPLSAVVQEYCAMVPRRPATHAALDAILAEEARLDPAVLERAVAGRRVFDLDALDPEAHGVPELEVEAVPPGATVIDLRSRAAHRAWHWPGALQLDLGAALQAYPSFDKEKSYVLYCEFGLKSAHLAELMRRSGFAAFHVKGGTKRLMALARADLAAPVRGRE
jgi:thiamine biosynthesis protein ThiI